MRCRRLVSEASRSLSSQPSSRTGASGSADQRISGPAGQQVSGSAGQRVMGETEGPEGIPAFRLRLPTHRTHVAHLHGEVQGRLRRLAALRFNRAG